MLIADQQTRRLMMIATAVMDIVCHAPAGDHRAGPPGLNHSTPSRAKSRSNETTEVRACRAKAVRCASLTRLPPTPVAAEVAAIAAVRLEKGLQP